MGFYQYHGISWANTKIKRYSRQKQRLYNRAINSGLADDTIKYKKFKTFMQKECRKAYNNYIASSISTSLPTQSEGYGHI